MPWGEPASVDETGRDQAVESPCVEVDAPQVLMRKRKAPFGSELPKGAISHQAVARFILSA